MIGDTLDLPQETFEPVISTSAELDQLGEELLLCFLDLDGLHELKTCYGDLLKIINALMDYTRLLEMVCDQWELHGFHRAMYECHAEKLREIAKKYQSAIGYDYEAAMEKCRKKKAKKRPDTDVGEDALVLALRKSQQPDVVDLEKADRDSELSPWTDAD